MNGKRTGAGEVGGGVVAVLKRRVREEGAVEGLRLVYPQQEKEVGEQFQMPVTARQVNQAHECGHPISIYSKFPTRPAPPHPCYFFFFPRRTLGGHVVDGAEGELIGGGVNALCSIVGVWGNQWELMIKCEETTRRQKKKKKKKKMQKGVARQFPRMEKAAPVFEKAWPGDQQFGFENLLANHRPCTSRTNVHKCACVLNGRNQPILPRAPPGTSETPCFQVGRLGCYALTRRRLTALCRQQPPTLATSRSNNNPTDQKKSHDTNIWEAFRSGTAARKPPNSAVGRLWDKNRNRWTYGRWHRQPRWRRGGQSREASSLSFLF